MDVNVGDTEKVSRFAGSAGHVSDRIDEVRLDGAVDRERRSHSERLVSLMGRNHFGGGGDGSGRQRAQPLGVA